MPNQTTQSFQWGDIALSQIIYVDGMHYQQCLLAQRHIRTLSIRTIFIASLLGQDSKQLALEV